MAHDPEHTLIDFSDKARGYAELEMQLTGLLQGERDLIANLANTAALIYHNLPDLNWAGFYLWRPDCDQLVLGPFQGKSACVRIELGKGVCGTAAATRQTQLVKDVHAFPGHIACDSASNSEIVIPLIFLPPEDSAAPSSALGHDLLGVLDLDSPVLARFDEQDQQGLEALCRVLMRSFI